MRVPTVDILYQHAEFFTMFLEVIQLFRKVFFTHIFFVKQIHANRNLYILFYEFLNPSRVLRLNSKCNLSVVSAE